VQFINEKLSGSQKMLCPEMMYYMFHKMLPKDYERTDNSIKERILNWPRPI